MFIHGKVVLKRDTKQFKTCNTLNTVEWLRYWLIHSAGSENYFLCFSLVQAHVVLLSPRFNMIQFVANFIIIVSCSRQIHVVSEFEHVKAIVLGLMSWWGTYKSYTAYKSSCMNGWVGWGLIIHQSHANCSNMFEFYDLNDVKNNRNFVALSHLHQIIMVKTTPFDHCYGHLTSWHMSRDSFKNQNVVT